MLPYERIGWISALSIAILLITYQTARVIRRDHRLREANEALSYANQELFDLNQNIQEKSKTLEVQNT